MVPRTHLFVPEEVPPGTFTNERTTLVDYCGRTRTAEDRRDGVYAVRKLPHEWTGRSRFQFAHPNAAPAYAGGGAKDGPDLPGADPHGDASADSFVHCCWEPISKLPRMFRKSHQ
eukprot:8082471-Alexandrium_andersonii.AAC.1